MNVIELDHERTNAARMLSNAEEFLEMEVEMNDVVQLARICNLLCEDLPYDRRVSMLHFAVTDLADRIDQMHGKYYARPDPEGDEHA